MANMSYCRWQNTLEALRDCHRNLFDTLDDPKEKAARISLIKMARAMVGHWDDEQETEARRAHDKG